jgi:hypothetical protein
MVSANEARTQAFLHESVARAAEQSAGQSPYARVFRRRLNVARAAWKRPGSPIGKKGPRKANPVYKRKLGEPWSKEDVKQLRALARENTPTGALSVKLQRPEGAIRSKAHREGISLRPTNQSPYNRRKRSR